MGYIQSFASRPENVSNMPPKQPHRWQPSTPITFLQPFIKLVLHGWKQKYIPWKTSLNVLVVTFELGLVYNTSEAYDHNSANCFSIIPCSKSYVYLLIFNATFLVISVLKFSFTAIRVWICLEHLDVTTSQKLVTANPVVFVMTVCVLNSI